MLLSCNFGDDILEHSEQPMGRGCVNIRFLIHVLQLARSLDDFSRLDAVEQQN
jgi:hypothetical protein